ncbi:gas vesicle protein [Candidatus Poribacteria bacterium]|nr:gas vesicle protein [Candidatus Poribacteria bacterium]
MGHQEQIVHSTNANNLVEILERVLDKGVVIAGDIRIKLLEVELLTINIRLLLASVERAKEMGIDWWEGNPFLSAMAERKQRLEQEVKAHQLEDKEAEIEALKKRISELEKTS